MLTIEERVMLRKIGSLLGLMWKYAKVVCIGKVFTIILGSALVTLKVKYTQVLIDSMIFYIKKNNTIYDVLYAAAILGTILLVDIVLNCFNGLLDIHCDKSLTNNLEPKLIEKFRRLDYFYFEDQEAQNVIKRVSGQFYLKIKTVFFEITEIIQIIFSLVGLSTIYFNVTPGLVVALVVILIPMILVNIKSSKYWWSLYNSQTEDERMLQYLTNLMSTKTTLAELKVFRAIKYIEKLWKQRTDKMLNEKMSILLKVQKYLLMRGALASLWYIATMIVTSVMFFNKSVTLGLFVSVIQSTILVVDYSEHISGVLGELSKNVMGFQYYDQFIEFNEIQESQEEYNFKEVDLEFRNVTFKYPKTNKMILNGVSFHMKPHENLAIVGANGAGKSTIIKLLFKFYKPTSGCILINGVDIQNISYKSIRKIMGVVFQDYFNYELSIRENVGFGNMDFINDDNKIIEAMKKSGADSILKKSNKGLDLPLGKLEQSGVDLSGGQWQKIAISRAYLSEAPVIILDEPTAALDPVAESNMYQMFATVMKKKGTIMISHRLASSKIADRILVLDGGVVVEEGSHDELITKKGLYHDMFFAQSSWYVKEEKNA